MNGVLAPDIYRAKDVKVDRDGDGAQSGATTIARNSRWQSVSIPGVTKGPD